MDLTLLIILCAVIGFLLWFIYKNFKIPKFGSFNLITGGVKSGKSLTSVWGSIKTYRHNRRVWLVRSFFQRLFRKPIDEEPLYYSNVKVKGVKCVFLDDDLIRRTKRFNYRSVIYIQEASLFADSMSYKYVDNDSLLLLCKLIGHETKGGKLFVDTQSISDCHYAIKRCVSTYYMIHHSISIPFFHIAYLREMSYDDNGNVSNVFNEDVEETLKRVIIPKLYYKYYDCYCYSSLTDDFEPVDKYVTYGKTDSLKINQIARAPKGEKTK